MREVDRSALVNFSARAMFDLVNDVARYSEFLPWCRSSEVLEESQDEMLARIEIARGGLNRSFTTRNALTAPERIEIKLVDGPFRHLRGAWQFKELSEDACKVSLHLEFQFSNRVMEMMLGPIFNQICESMLDAFVKRAHGIYAGSGAESGSGSP